MSLKKFNLKSDKYSKARGVYSRFLDIACARCSKHICYYQKDGAGILKSMYFDRISGFKINPKQNLTCPKCKEILGMPIIYKKEKRQAYRLFVGAINKKNIKV